MNIQLTDLQAAGIAKLVADYNARNSVDNPDFVPLQVEALATLLLQPLFNEWADLAARMPGRFAAVLPICGGGDEATAPKLAKLPIWCFHGDADDAVPVRRSRTMIAALRAAGAEPRYSELAGVGHDAWTPAYRDPEVLAWLLGKRRHSGNSPGIER